MRATAYVVATVVLMTAVSVFAHGPQIQVTNDGSKIVTRQLFLDGPYYNTLSASTSVYVMPVLDSGGVWYSRPNTTYDPLLEGPAFVSGPGLAYGYDLADGGPQAFAEGSVLSIGFTAPLLKWNGSTFVDAGATQLKAFRGSNVNVASPPENFAVTSDAGPFDNVSLAAVAANYGSEGPDVHSSLRFALLGDGSSATSPLADGVYLLSMQLSSTQSGLAASEPYYFVLYKNAANEAVQSAVSTLGISASQIQWLAVPEPATGAIAVLGLVLIGCGRRVRSNWRFENRGTLTLTLHRERRD
jgi:hypothetical protein